MELKKRLGRLLRVLVVTLAVLVVVVALVAVLAFRALVEPDRAKFGNVQDEALAATPPRTRESFPAAADEFLVDMDKGALAPPATRTARGLPAYTPEVAALARRTGLDEETVRVHAVKGQNTWNVWTGGNDRFWDALTGFSFGTFDLLKVLSSHPELYHGRRNRWSWLGLVNEPCFTEATPATAAAEPFGLYLDVRDPSCAPDPFADAERYPGVKTGARGRTLTLKDGGQVTLPVGSFYGEPSGIVGLRLFPNPAFDEAAAARWDPDRYYTDPDYYQDKDLVRPYRVGMSCGFCHVGPSPVNPPPDPESPGWQHINSNPGAQYFWLDRIFFWDSEPRPAPGKPAPNEHNIIWQLFHTNPPGSLDTSLVSTDYINNPRTMNAVYNVGARLEPTLRWGRESLTGGELDNRQFQSYPQTRAFSQFWNPDSGEVKTARVLKDGADSVGILGALNRVYLNIGLFSEEWLLHFRPVVGGRKISPIEIGDAQKNSAYWGATEDQTADMAVFFLVTATPDDLEDVVEERGAKHLLPDGDPLVERGKVVFARNCAACHSSKIPDAPAGSGVDEGVCRDGGNGPHYRECWDRYWGWTKTEDFKKAMTGKVLAHDFLEDNFLSTERRIPSDVMGTNACSPLATNALADDIWDNFSSTSYKALPPVGETGVHHPVSGGVSSLTPAGGGRGYTRPASLVSLWTSAPYLLNNSVGYTDHGYTDHGYAAYGGDGNGGAIDEGSGQDAGDGYDAGSDGAGSPGYAGKRYRAGPPARGYSGYGRGRGGGRYGGGGDHDGGGYAGVGYGAARPARCPDADGSDPYLPCVENRMRMFHDSIGKLLYPERRRVDEHTRLPVPGYMYRTTASSCLEVPKGFMPDIVANNPGLFNWLAPWAIEEDGSLALGPLPPGFPVNALVNTKLLPDNDEPEVFDHYWRLLKAAPTLLKTFKRLGGMCSAQELARPGAPGRAERIVQRTRLADTLVGLSKCPDYVVNRGHTFGSHLPDSDKQALIEYLKHF